MKTKQNTSPKLVIGVVAFIVVTALISIGGNITNLSVSQGGSTGSIKGLKDSDDLCNFTLSATWSPTARNDMSISYRVGDESGKPRTIISPWNISRKARCSSSVLIQVSQSVYSGHQASCKIAVNRVIVSRYMNKKTSYFQCTW